VSYNSDGTTTLTNALGKRTTFHFIIQHGVKKIVHVEGEPTATCQGSAKEYSFDDNGFLIEKTDAKGIVSQYSRDEHGLELSRTDAVGLPEARTVTTEWDQNLRQPLRVLEGNSETRNAYDTQGRLTARTTTDLATGATRTTRYDYNERGLLISTDGPREDVADITRYSYDAAGKLARVTNALGQVTEIVSRDPYGRPVLIRDANGMESQLRYDESGRLVERMVGGQSTTMAYDAVGNLLRVSAPGGVVIEYRYDAANRLTGISDTVGNRIEYTLDAMGNRTGEDVLDAAGALMRTHRKVYDELSRLLQSIGASGQRSTYSYDQNNNLTVTIDPLQQLHQSAYDGLNRLVKQTDALQGTTRYSYDGADHLTGVTDPNGNATTYAYDGLGNLLEQQSPDTGTTRYTHDAAGNVLTKGDARGTTSYTYDALNRLTRVLYADGSEALYEYDSAAHGIGRLARLRDSSGEMTWRYDTHGHTADRTQQVTVDGISHTLTTAWQYNAAGQMVGTTYPSGLQVGYDYSNGKISAVTVNGTPLLSAISYQPFGPVTGWQWANGSTQQRGYDLDGRLITQSLGSSIRTLSYDLLGNITAITDPAQTRRYSYDELSRLSAANDASLTLGWSYDANGNRLSETDAGITTPYSIDATSNRLLAVADLPRQYDATGNLIQDSEYSYQYDAQQRLSAVDEGATGLYRYNALGQRVYKKGIAAPCDVNGDGTVDHADLKLVTGKDKVTVEADGPGKGEAKGKGQSIACIATQMNNGKGQGRENEGGSRQLLFAYDEHRLLGEYDMAGNTVQETVWLGNTPVATIQNGGTYFIHTDHLGTPRVITDGNNTELWRWESDPFGVAAANEDVDGDGVLFSYNLRFPGQYFDEETGLHYNYFRDYDPSTGRYIQSDPIGLEGGANTYGYVAANPMNLFDIFGLKYSKEDCAKLLALINGQYQMLMIYEEMSVTGKIRPGTKIGTYANTESDCEETFPDEGRRTMCQVHEQYHSDNWHRVKSFPDWLGLLFGGDQDEFRRNHAENEIEATQAGINTGEKLFKENCSDCQ
jgi:RHS repeat-associated protein